MIEYIANKLVKERKGQYMSKEYNEESKAYTDESDKEGEYVYKNVINKKEQKRTWSVVSLILAMLSVLLLYFSWVGLVLGLLSVACAVISRKNLGYFDKITLCALIVAIFGVVFGICGIAFGDILAGLFK